MPITARAPHAVTPVNRTAYVDMATVPLVQSLYDNPDLPRFYLLEVKPYDSDSMTVVTRTYGAGISRVPGRDVLWHPLLINAFNVTTELFNGPFGVGGAGSVSFGAIKIAIGGEAEVHYMLRDEFSWLNWNQRAVKLYMGGDPALGWTFNDYVLVFSGLAEDVSWDEDYLTIAVRDPNVRLEKQIQSTLYAGTGLDEGGEDLEGKPKPLAYGRPRNISPVLIDRTNLVYQIHDGPIVAVDAVYDRGDAYTSAGDLPGAISDLRDWTGGAAGQYATDLASGLIRLWTTPNGIVTADVQGDSDSGSLRETQGELLRRILKSRAAFTDDELDLASLAALDSNGREVSLYIDSPASIAQAADAILLPGGYRTFDASGRFRAGRVEFATPVINLSPPRIVGILRDRPPLPSWRISLGYRRNWTPMRETDLAAAGLDLSADFATNEYRRVTAATASVLTRVPGAKDDKVDTAWNDSADAQSEVDSLHSLLSEDRHLYRVTAARIQFRVRPGNTVRLRHERFGLRDGVDFIALGVTENTQTGLTHLELWG